MKLYKISEMSEMGKLDPSLSERPNTLENPIREQFESEQGLLKPKDNYWIVTEFIDGLEENVYDLQQKIKIMKEEREMENWEYFKKIGVL